MSSPRTFFNACLGLTLILPLFFVDLEAIGLVVGKTAGNTVEASSDDVVRKDACRCPTTSLVGGISTDVRPHPWSKTHTHGLVLSFT